MKAECAVLTVSFRSLPRDQRHWRYVLSHSRSSGPVPPAKDVRALLDKANIGSMRHLTSLRRKQRGAAKGITHLPARAGGRSGVGVYLGMTVLDHAPQVAVVKDFAELAAFSTPGKLLRRGGDRMKSSLQKNVGTSGTPRISPWLFLPLVQTLTIPVTLTQ